MPLTLASNIISLAVQRGINKTSQALGQSYLRLSTGLRVNSAGDDPSGIGIAARMTAKIGGLAQASKNVNDGISLTQIADTALSETVNSLQRIRDLAVAAKSSTASSGDRASMQTEVNLMISEINRLASTTKFNGYTIISSTTRYFSFQIGPDQGNTLLMTVKGASVGTLGLGTNGTSAVVSGAAAPTYASKTILLVDSALDSVSSIRATLGGAQTRFLSIINQINGMSDAYTSAKSSIMDANVASETANLTRNNILQQAGIAVLAQANLQPQTLLQLLRNP
ncbi:MAG: flagellin FliC [Magnetococcales bacterium]|nr:flagellin FliC [Magnetococcales bacterium]MBF0433785.1 flagellin FliC [Magnetococcales bacterium]